MSGLFAVVGPFCAKESWAQRPFPPSNSSAESTSQAPFSSENDASAPAWAATQKSASTPVEQQKPTRPAPTDAFVPSSRVSPPLSSTPVSSIGIEPAKHTAPSRLSEERPLSDIKPVYTGEIQQTGFSVEKLLETPLADVIVEGNETIPSSAIYRHVLCRPGRLATPRMVQQDVTQILNTRWFYSVTPTYRESDEGPILVFKVVEKPILERVTFRGNKKIKVGELEAHTGLRPMHAYDVSANRESVHRIRQLYFDKGYRFAEVTLTKGGSPDDREVIFDIVEGPKPKIWSISVNGNQDISSSILKTKISSKTVKLWVIQGDYDTDVIRNDELALKQYYMGLGYFDVDVKSDVKLSDDRAKVSVNFLVDEGARYRVEGIEVLGNDVIARDKLLSNLKLKRGDYFNERFLKEDVTSMTNLYDEQGRLFAKVIPTPRFREGTEPVVDLIYNIDEDVPRYIGQINIRIRGDYPRSQEEVVRQQAGRFLKPGYLARSSDLQMAKARVFGSGIWDREEAPNFAINPVAGTDYLPQTFARGQSETRDDLRPTSAVWNADELLSEAGMEDFFWGPPERRDASTPVPVPEKKVPARLPRRELDLRTETRLESEPVSALPPPSRSLSAIDRAVRTEPAPQATRPVYRELASSEPTPIRAEADQVIVNPDIVFRGQSEPMVEAQSYGPPPGYAAPPGYGSPPTIYRPQSIDAYGQQVPQDYLQGVSPQGDPFGDALSQPPAGFVDVNIDVTEGRTGRLMFGVGVNSDAGVVGSLVLQEDNFDLFRPPTSWSDIINGTAWRGAGQSMRIEAVPGSEVSRYMATWNNPYFLRSDFSLGVSGFYYNRFFESWTEDRLGGRINVGYVLNKYWSVSAALRLENVDMRNIPAGAPATLTSVRGDNFLSTGAATLTYDARDNAFMPTRGNFASFTYEQAFGEFSYPKFDLTASQYFTVYERPDGFGKHVLALTGQLGFTGDGTPVFERYFAGGYSSFRGFYFRGVSPVESGYRVGGDFMALGSAEYMIPITAGDNLRAVLFTDFGTVDPDVSLDNFRLSVGFGFRVTIPAMGPAPLAFDFGFPILKEAYDRERMFSFYVGLTR
ncbi:MAG TPA: BamA/TamA family outer membrane protein [Planctomicrobium sp.]|nr:BamA/TamA family outer membrane protein [Planctomicrobium sp.]